MRFTLEEMAAVMKLGMAMVSADGRADEREFDVVRKELSRFGASVGQMLSISNEAQKMDFDRAINLVSNFETERKRYVASYLAVIMIADGEIVDKEVALWQLVSLLCGLPEMDVNQAVDNLNNL